MKKNLKVKRNLKKDLFSIMLKIRIAEEKIVSVYQEQNMRTPTHLSIGQEAVAAGVCQALSLDDQVFAPHRCHAHYLAKGGDLDGFFAELCGKQTGSSGGRIGSAHLTDDKAGIFASPILGAMIPVAVGAALSFKMNKEKKVAVACFGDAAIEEGVFSESLNFAVVKKLPILFVCENNLYSTNSPLKVRQPPSAIYKRVKIPELSTCQIDGNDVERVNAAAREAVQRCRQGKGPAFIECLTYRVREHVGPLFDYDRGYRSKKEVDGWINKCPIKRYQAKLIKEKVLTLHTVDDIKRNVMQDVELSYTKAMRSPWPKPETLLEHVY